MLQELRGYIMGSRKAPTALQSSPGLAALRGSALGRRSLWMCCLLKVLNANLAALTAEFEKATAEKIKCQQEADATNRVITLANRYPADAGSRDTSTLLLPGTAW